MGRPCEFDPTEIWDSTFTTEATRTVRALRQMVRLSVSFTYDGAAHDFSLGITLQDQTRSTIQILSGTDIYDGANYSILTTITFLNATTLRLNGPNTGVGPINVQVLVMEWY